jgi:hypothetical protein
LPKVRSLQFPRGDFLNDLVRKERKLGLVAKGEGAGLGVEQANTGDGPFQMLQGNFGKTGSRDPANGTRNGCVPRKGMPWTAMTLSAAE